MAVFIALDHLRRFKNVWRLDDMDDYWVYEDHSLVRHAAEYVILSLALISLFKAARAALGALRRPDVPLLRDRIVSGVPGAEIPKPAMIELGPGQRGLAELLRAAWPGLGGCGQGARPPPPDGGGGGTGGGGGGRRYRGPPVYKGPWWLPGVPGYGGLAQTAWVGALYEAPRPAVDYRRELVPMPDGGVVRLDTHGPAGGGGGGGDGSGGEEGGGGGGSGPGAGAAAAGGARRGTVVLLPGLTSSSKDVYVRNAAATLAAGGWRVVVMNNRGLGDSPLTTPWTYNGATTADLRHLLRRQRREVGEGEPLALLGFSLGANVAAKYLGEEGARTPVDFACVVGNPWDLPHINRKLPYIVTNTLATNLQEFQHSKAAKFVEGSDKISNKDVLAAKTIKQYDEAFLRRHFGYASVGDYYRDGSSIAYIKAVRVPMLAVNALDDPVVHWTGLPFDELASNPYTAFITTRTGGHLGWFQTSDRRNREKGASSVDQRWICNLIRGFFDLAVGMEGEQGGESDLDTPRETLPRHQKTQQHAGGGGGGGGGARNDDPVAAGFWRRGLLRRPAAGAAPPPGLRRVPSAPVLEDHHWEADAPAAARLRRSLSSRRFAAADEGGGGAAEAHSAAGVGGEGNSPPTPGSLRRSVSMPMGEDWDANSGEEGSVGAGGTLGQEGGLRGGVLPSAPHLQRSGSPSGSLAAFPLLPGEVQGQQQQDKQSNGGVNSIAGCNCPCRCSSSKSSKKGSNH